jgi:hypothetical protein
MKERRCERLDTCAQCIHPDRRIWLDESDLDARLIVVHQASHLGEMRHDLLEWPRGLTDIEPRVPRLVERHRMNPTAECACDAR